MKKLLTITISLIATLTLPVVALAAVLSTPVTVGTNFPAAGMTTSVSGSCGTSGANNTVSFSLLQNGNTTVLPTSANLSTGSSGEFSGNVTLPSSATSGAATLIATCNLSGDTTNSSLTFSAPASSSLTIGTSGPIVGNTANLSGACGNSSGTGTVDIRLNNNGVTTTLGTANLSNTGTFNTNVAIPSTTTVPGAILTAVCSNGTTLSSPITAAAQAVNLFSFDSNPMIGSTVTARGTCLGDNADANGTVRFSLIQANGVTTQLSTTNATTNTSGNFVSNVTFPATVNDGLGTLVVTCPNGNTFSTLIAADSGVLTVLPPGTVSAPMTPPTTPAVGGTPEGSVLGATTTPVGGVNAGHQGRDSKPELLAIAALILAGSLSVVIGRRLFVS